MHAPEPPPPLGVLVVAATRVRRDRLSGLLDGQGVRVVAAVDGPAAAVAVLLSDGADVLLLDTAPDAGGVRVVERVMAERPVPILLTGAAAADPAGPLAAGAADLVEADAESHGPAAFAAMLRERVDLLRRVRVITHPRGRLRDQGIPVDRVRGAGPEARRPGTPLVLVGASTGGPPALAALLGGLPADLPAAIVIVQHMADGFVGGLARWLDAASPLPVTVALDGQRLSPGQVVLAPSGSNLLLDLGPRVRLTSPEPRQHHVPGIDPTFASAAAVCRGRAVGVLLTGMGRDGAAGLAALRSTGAVTLAQDEATSAVWGMPGAATNLGAVDHELALEAIAPAVVAAVGRLAVVASASVGGGAA